MKVCQCLAGTPHDGASDGSLLDFVSVLRRRQHGKFFFRIDPYMFSYEPQRAIGVNCLHHAYAVQLVLQLDWNMEQWNVEGTGVLRPGGNVRAQVC